MSRHGPRRANNGRAAFRALEGEVREALAAGWTVRAIYDEKQKRLSMSYSQFARYAQQLRARIAETRSSGESPQQRQPVGLERANAPLRAGPLRGRPEDAVPNLKMDRFAVEALENEDLI
jgi:hypothetical protein